MLGRGRPYPQGATLTASGANFALYSQHATAVELCLFDAAGAETRVALPETSGHVWHGFVPGVHAGQRYGFRVEGPYAPARGERFNPHKLLVDPYARAVLGRVSYVDGAVLSLDGDVGEPDRADSAAYVPKSIVTDGSFDWGNDAPLDIPWRDTVIYELHVKGFTKTHPDVPEALRGTYAGLASDAAIAHLTALGVTAVELLPIAASMDEVHVARRGLVNYWGYSPLAYFAPEPRYASRPADAVHEFKAMVKSLHAAGIEVILDVVYNHTGEGDHLGPTVCFRGIDNAVYYRLRDDDRSRYVDLTGCGNTFNVGHPQVLRLVCDSLRYWVTEMHVDGFRFDLATVLGRDDGGFDPGAAFFDIVQQDPVLSRVKLIAEPWDCSPDGFRLGEFPVGFREWNAKFRDGVRGFWNGLAGGVGELAYRVSGSSDVFGRPGRGPDASINLVTAHDGFTLRDLVTYVEKHNGENGEHNVDGWGHNLSINFGVEGETDDPAIVAARLRQVRNFFATLLLSPGVPMLVAGDEIGKTQRGNNNPYCVDAEVSWLDWKIDGDQRDLLSFVRGLVALRRELPLLHRTTFFRGDRGGPRGVKDLTWLLPDANEMSAADWGDGAPRTLGALFSGTHDQDGDLLLLVNAEAHAVSFRLPRRQCAWRVLVDTRAPRVPFGGIIAPQVGAEGARYEMTARSLVLLRSV